MYARLLGFYGLELFDFIEIYEQRRDALMKIRRVRGGLRLAGVLALAVGALALPAQAAAVPAPTVTTGGVSNVASVSRFGAVVRLRHRGLYRALIKVTNDGAHVSNYSEPILIR
jgi:hypothetical protein